MTTPPGAQEMAGKGRGLAVTSPASSSRPTAARPGSEGMTEFKEFPKIARLSREIIVTEKIDGTNAIVYVPAETNERLLVGSRNRWVPPGEDHFGFVKWVAAHEEELRLGLGPGYHYGEWWGSGVGRRGYDLPAGERRWSLFNVSRWVETRPACCHVVPVIERGLFHTDLVTLALDRLRSQGSFAAPGFMRPEGVVIYHVQGNILFKKTLEKDEQPKGDNR